MELKSAIARIGFSNVRTAALAYAMDQVKNAAALQPIRKPLNKLWERSIKVAAIAFVAARRWTQVNADKALLAGLMHHMGRVYILTRASRHPELLSDPEAYQQIVRDWSTPIAKIVLENWEISPDIVDAIEQYQDVDRQADGLPDLADVLAIADLLVSFGADHVALERLLVGSPTNKRLELSADACQAVLAEAAGEISDLRQALGS